MQIDHSWEALCPICGQGRVDPALQVCVLCEAQILVSLPRDPAFAAAYALDGEDLLSHLLLTYPDWNAQFGTAQTQAWTRRLRASGHLPLTPECGSTSTEGAVDAAL
jgi:hypothetical protein